MAEEGCNGLCEVVKEVVVGGSRWRLVESWAGSRRRSSKVDIATRASRRRHPDELDGASSAGRALSIFCLHLSPGSPLRSASTPSIGVLLDLRKDRFPPRFFRPSESPILAQALQPSLLCSLEVRKGGEREGEQERRRRIWRFLCKQEVSGHVESAPEINTHLLSFPQSLLKGSKRMQRYSS